MRFRPFGPLAKCYGPGIAQGVFSEGHMQRREFITLLGSGAAWPLAAHAQQPAMPVVGFLGAPAAAPYGRYVAAIHQGLREAGYVEGQNVTFEYRWADGHYDRLPTLAVDLVSRGVSVIICIGGAPAAVAAKATTSTIPIVVNISADPVKLGLVGSLNRPGGNVTGIAMLGVELEAKKLELLHQLIPASALVAVVVNPSNAQAESQVQDLQKAAQAIGQRILVLNAGTEHELENVFARAVHERADALFVGQDTFFTSEPNLIAALAARHAIPTMSPWRSHVEAGGLMSYGTNLTDAYRQAGIYAGRVLKGEKPGDLPVVQSVKFELIINLKTARALRLTIPDRVLAIADEVIE
jgi:putative tryptophan/tyrosine transport system substrate-binding protein